ncbi:MAG: pyridoxamine 5'-phosphate oxidase family protein [Alphaproteobacteria bacterium]|nr:pyridoxamine 5'-phosphate oxidase family protein [Alphaproteobacteria bacterium]
MAQQFDALAEEHVAFIARQHMFFVASAADGAKINLSPKGLGGFRVIDAKRVCYLDLTGSGAETAAHMKADGRLTIMLCAFEGQALILRLYGRGRSLPRGGAAYADLLAAHFGAEAPPGARQIVTLDIDLVQTSCGYGVPKYAYEGERETLIRWAQTRGEDGLAAYRAEKNAVSLDGLETGLSGGDA